MAKRPTDQQLETAIAWLECNEGDDSPEGERSSCVAVALYLEGLLERRTANRFGCSVSYLRRIGAEQVQA